VITGQGATSRALPRVSLTPLFTGLHFKVAKLLVGLPWCDGGVGCIDVLDLAIFEMFALRNPAVGATLVGMHILSIRGVSQYKYFLRFSLFSLDDFRRMVSATSTFFHPLISLNCASQL